jgi:hypothetical protein
MRGVGRAAFVAILLLIAGALNVVYGIAACCWKFAFLCQ